MVDEREHGIYDDAAAAQALAPHFAADGAHGVEIRATSEDRLASWRTLQEMAGQGGSL